MQTLGGIGQLRWAQGDAGHTGAHVADGDFRQAAPAAANFQNTLALPGGHTGHAQRTAHLGLLRGRQFLAVVAIKPSGGIGHGVVQPQAVKRVAQVVMRMDVFAAVGLGVAPHPVPHLVGQAAPPGAENHVVHGTPVDHQKLQQSREVGRVPVAGDEALCKTNVARAQRRAKHLPVVQLQSGLWAALVAKENGLTIGQLQMQAAHLQRLQHAQSAFGRGRHLFAQQGQRQIGSVQSGCHVKGNQASARVANSAGGAGLRTKGTRLSHRPKACQWMRQMTPKLCIGCCQNARRKPAAVSGCN